MKYNIFNGNNVISIGNDKYTYNEFTQFNKNLICIIIIFAFRKK